MYTDFKWNYGWRIYPALAVSPEDSNLSCALLGFSYQTIIVVTQCPWRLCMHLSVICFLIQATHHSLRKRSSAGRLISNLIHRWLKSMDGLPFICLNLESDLLNTRRKEKLALTGLLRVNAWYRIINFSSGCNTCSFLKSLLSNSLYEKWSTFP